MLLDRERELANAQDKITTLSDDLLVTQGKVSIVESPGFFMWASMGDIIGGGLRL